MITDPGDECVKTENCTGKIEGITGCEGVAAEGTPAASTEPCTKDPCCGKPEDCDKKE